MGLGGVRGREVHSITLAATRMVCVPGLWNPQFAIDPFPVFGFRFPVLRGC